LLAVKANYIGSKTCMEKTK